MIQSRPTIVPGCLDRGVQNGAAVPYGSRSTTSYFSLPSSGLGYVAGAPKLPDNIVHMSQGVIVADFDLGLESVVLHVQLYGLDGGLADNVIRGNGGSEGNFVGIAQSAQSTGGKRIEDWETSGGLALCRR